MILLPTASLAAGTTDMCHHAHLKPCCLAVIWLHRLVISHLKSGHRFRQMWMGLMVAMEGEI
jgi:hypothetical protein